MLPWPDVKVTSKLCIEGPCCYKLKEGMDVSDEWLIEHVVPNIACVFPSDVALVLVLPPLWAVFDDDFKHMVSPEITYRIWEAYNRLPWWQTTAENSVKKFLLVATGQEGEVHLDEVADLEAGREETGRGKK
eukprot:13739266-Ditylum_brightwellii.AAC.1